jgi:arsenite methyltransferase
VISNCVINLSGDKERVLSEIWRVLKEGGELFFSDVFSDRRIPEHLKKDSVLWGECLSGALYIEDFRRMMERVGFKTYYTMKQSVITINNSVVQL